MSKKEDPENFDLNDIIIILHEDGDTTFIYNEEHEITDEQLDLFVRFYLCTNPSIMLRIFLIIEKALTSIEAFFRNLITKKS